MSMSWSTIRKKLEQEYLADALKGHIKYFVTRYRKCHDQEGRTAILYNGKEIIKGCFFKWVENRFILDDIIREENIEVGGFDQQSFYHAFYIYNNQSIEESLKSDNIIIRIFSLLDKRVGKRTLLKLKETIVEESQTIQKFYYIRSYAENIL